MCRLVISDYLLCFFLFKMHSGKLGQVTSFTNVGYLSYSCSYLPFSFVKEKWSAVIGQSASVYRHQMIKLLLRWL